MAIFKMTMLFQHLSGASTPNLPTHRTGGWSESWYINKNTAADVISAAANGNVPPAIGLLPARAALLGLGSAIVGLRIQQVSPYGPTQSIGTSYPGVPTNLTDVPQMALLGKAPGLGTNNIRRFVLRGIPDAQVVEGEYQPQGAFGASVNTFLTALVGWQYRARDLAQTTNKILTIAVGATTLVTFENPVAYAVNDMVRVMRVLDSTKTLRGARCQITAIGPGNNNVTISGWTFGNGTGGTMRKDAIVFPQVDINTVAISRAITRRVGRPFVGYRGRRSKRR